MKMPEIHISKRKTQNKKHRWSLTLTYSITIFAILFISISIVSMTVSILMHNDVLFIMDDRIPEAENIIIFMGVVSIVIGYILAVFIGRIPLKPINEVITAINRLADGDFSARLNFKSRPVSKAFKEVSDSFNKMAEELQNTEMLRSDFINNFSHEFKTPIVSIAGFAEVLESDELNDEERKKYILSIKEESLRLAHMATDVLNMTKLENQNILADRNMYNVSEQIRSTILLFESKWESKRIELDIDFDEYYFNGSEELMGHVWMNLFDNAVKFCDEGGTIRIAMSAIDNYLTVSFSNTGAAIPEEKREKIFSKFYQADESHSREGSGIGLAVVKKVVELHEGHISVGCTGGVTTFVVVVPQF